MGKFFWKSQGWGLFPSVDKGNPAFGCFYFGKISISIFFQGWEAKRLSVMDSK